MGTGESILVQVGRYRYIGTIRQVWKVTEDIVAQEGR